MSEHALAQQQMTNEPQEAAKDSLSLQHRHTPLAEPAVLQHEGLFNEACGTFAEPRFGYDFSLVPAHTDTTQRVQPLLRTGTMVQRYPVNMSEESAPCATCSDEESAPISTPSEPAVETASLAPEAAPTPASAGQEEESAAPEETAAPALIVEDSVTELSEGQMRKSEFLAQLRAAVTSTAESAMAGTGRTTADCPYLDYWFGYYSLRSAQHGERTLRRYAPEASGATSARDYIPIVAERVRRSVETWVRTGEVMGVPEGMSASLPGETPAGSGGSAPAAGGPVMAKARDGGIRSVDNPQAIQAELRQGRPLDSGVRSRMESAFGRDFSHVRTHTDTAAVGLSNRLNARAFTVGEHVAFGAGEYRPGTLIGDALIAHEMAHVVQQSGAGDSVVAMETDDIGYNTLEKDADRAAIGAIVSLLTGAKEGLYKIAQNALPRLKSGIHLSRCDKRTVRSIEVVSGANAIGVGSSAPANTQFAASIKGRGEVVVEAVLDSSVNTSSLPANFISWTGGAEVPGNQLQRKVNKSTWAKHTLTATAEGNSASQIVYIIAADGTDFSPSNGTSGTHFTHNSAGYASTGIVSPNPSTGNAESKCEIQFDIKPNELAVDGNADLFDTDDVKWDVSRDKKVKKWTKTGGTWSLVDDRGGAWASDDIRDTEEDNIPWDGDGHLYGNDRPTNRPGRTEAYVKKMNMREWVRVGLGSTTGRSGNKCSGYYLWHVFRSLKKNGTWSGDNTYGNEVSTGNIFWGSTPLP